jgi:hypothetical protein
MTMWLLLEPSDTTGEDISDQNKRNLVEIIYTIQFSVAKQGTNRLEMQHEI